MRVKKMQKNPSVLGPDGWRAAELQALPSQLFEKTGKGAQPGEGDKHVVCSNHTRSDIAVSQGRRIRIHGVCVQAVGFDEDL